jgi:hypothetical protein
MNGTVRGGIRQRIMFDRPRLTPDGKKVSRIIGGHRQVEEVGRLLEVQRRGIERQPAASKQQAVDTVEQRIEDVVRCIERNDSDASTGCTEKNKFDASAIICSMRMPTDVCWSSSSSSSRSSRWTAQRSLEWRIIHLHID